MKRSGLRAIVLLLVCSLCGCSLFYSYRNVERYIRWSLDDYVDWNAAQETTLRARLAAQLEWHGQTQLPRYREWLIATDRMLDDDVDVAQVAQAADELEAFWQDVAAQIEVDLREQLASLSAAQVRDLGKVLRERQEEWRDEYVDLSFEKLVDKRRREMTRTVKYWLGPLHPRQLALIDAWARQLPDGRNEWLAARARWTAAFEQALLERHDAAAFAAHVHRLFVTPRETWTTEFRELQLHNRTATLQLLADLHNARTPKQRAAERRRVAQWLHHMDQLAAN